MSNAVAFVVNNLLLVIAGGFVAVWLAWRMWQKVEGIARTTNDVPSLVFWAVKMIVIVAVLFRVGGWIYANVNSAVIAAVNSTSVQTTGQALVALAGGVDSVFNADIASSISGGAQAVNLIAPSAPAEVEPVMIQGSTTASFASTPFSPSNISTGPIMTAAQAVDAMLAMQATATPEAIVFINEFVADNSPTVAVTAASSGGYVVKHGDSLAKIAKAFYGDSKKWRVICDANRKLWRDCNNIAVGITLIIPAVDGSAAPANIVEVPAVIQLAADVKLVQVSAPVPVRVAPTAVPVVQQVVTAADAVAVINAVKPVAVQPVAIPAVVVQAIAKPTPSADDYIAQFLSDNLDQSTAQK